MSEIGALLSDPAFPSVRVPSFPAPWALSGRGYIILYHFDRAFVLDRGFLPEASKADFAGGIGAVMVVDYASSAAGSYGELLFIPGKFKALGRKWDRITKIYVSTVESVLNGRENWAIPKERADFAFERSGPVEKIAVSTGGRTFFRARFETTGPRFPMSTSLLPFPLLQPKDGGYLQTTFSGHGRGRLAKVSGVEVDQRLFPELALSRPLMAIGVEPFDIVFPVARAL
jgi:Acetoacetate decarboxylase (ADC).